MGIARRPAGYAGGRRAPDGSKWYVGREEFDENPRLTLPSDVWPMIHLWRMYRGNGMGQGHLPDAGGTLDQSVHLMTCFHIMSAADNELEQADRENES